MPRNPLKFCYNCTFKYSMYILQIFDKYLEKIYTIRFELALRYSNLLRNQNFAIRTTLLSTLYKLKIALESFQQCTTSYLLIKGMS